MRKTTNMVEYNLKGNLSEFNDPIIKTEIPTKDDVKEDTLNLETFLQDIVNFCNNNMDKNIELKFSIKVIEENEAE